VSSRLSQRYLALCRRLQELRVHLLPSAFDPLGSYTAAQFDQTRAYVALVHAEIEDFLEERCLEVADACVSRWLKLQQPTAVIVALHATCYSGWTDLIDNPKFKRPTFEASVEARLQASLEQYTQAIGGNNGIKEADIKRLLVPLSVRMSNLDQTWCAAMSSFGMVRGQIAHKTSVGATHTADPKDMRRTVWKDLVPGLRKLDLVLTSLL
jgi:hypothetical protein